MNCQKRGTERGEKKQKEGDNVNEFEGKKGGKNCNKQLLTCAFGPAVH